MISESQTDSLLHVQPTPSIDRGVWHVGYDKTRLRNIKLVVMDVDGTLTDGAMYYGVDGEEMKRFSARDGMGITLLHRAGLQTAILTSENTPIVTKRAAKLKINHVILGSHEKHTALRTLADTLGMALENVCFIGDDVNDSFAIQVAGFSAAPSDAVDNIKSRVSYVTQAKGGYGAVREVAELILQSQDKPISLPETW